MDLYESRITRAIITAYCEKLAGQVVGDVVVVGAGPSGLVAASHLARRGLKVTLLEKRLSPGGGIWGGAAAMNEVVIQDRALPLLEEVAVSYRAVGGGLHVIDAVELASAGRPDGCRGTQPDPCRGPLRAPRSGYGSCGEPEQCS